MKELPIEVKSKSSDNLLRATLLVPETVDEMVAILGKRFVIESMTRLYISREKRRLASGWKPREKVFKIKEGALTAEQKNALVSMGLIAAE